MGVECLINEADQDLYVSRRTLGRYSRQPSSKAANISEVNQECLALLAHEIHNTSTMLSKSSAYKAHVNLAIHSAAKDNAKETAPVGGAKHGIKDEACYEACYY